LQQLHPSRLQYEVFSNANPMMAPLAAMAEQVRNNRKPAAEDNPFIAIQENASRQIVAALDAWRDFNETLAERMFLAVYGSFTLQAAAGIDPASTRPLRKAPKTPMHHELLQSRIAELKARIPIGGLREALVRSLLYVGMPRAAVDERGFEAVRRIRRAHSELPLSAFKALVREQFHILLVDEEAALTAIPSLLPADADSRVKAIELIKQVIAARGELSAEDKERMQRVVQIFGVNEKKGTVRNLAVVPLARKEGPAKAS
jgi:hypothetical protein